MKSIWDVGGGILIVALFVLVILTLVLALNYFSSSGPNPVANFYGNDTLGVTCEHGTPVVTTAVLRGATEIVVKCK